MAAAALPRTALVTGGASGMGRLVVERLLALGARVAVVDLSADELQAMAAADERVLSIVSDVTDPESVNDAAELALDAFGGIDRLVLAAGIGHAGPILSTNPQDFDRLVDINYLGVVRWVNEVVPSMVDTGSGEVVIFASMAGWIPSVGMGPYCASKAAVVSYADALAQELTGTGVNVLTICPPAVATPMLDSFTVPGGLSRKGLKFVPPIQPEQVVDAIEPALRRGSLYLFPGRGSKAFQLAQRFAPGLVRRAMISFYEEP